MTVDTIKFSAYRTASYQSDFLCVPIANKLEEKAAGSLMHCVIRSSDQASPATLASTPKSTLRRSQVTVDSLFREKLFFILTVCTRANQPYRHCCSSIVVASKFCLPAGIAKCECSSLTSVAARASLGKCLLIPRGSHRLFVAILFVHDESAEFCRPHSKLLVVVTMMQVTQFMHDDVVDDCLGRHHAFPMERELPGR